MSKVVGIDLGTSNSRIAVLDGATPQVIPNQEGARTTPSFVAFTSSGEKLVGQPAKRRALTNPKNTVFSFHRLLGQRFDSPEVQTRIAFLPYSIVEADNGDAHVQIEDSVYSPTQLCGMVLQKLKASAENYLGERIEEAIVAVPIHFNDAQRHAIGDAGTLAGLKIQRFLNSGSAAALAYGMLQRKVGRVVVYDLGGSTFDITILELQDGIYQVLSTAGDTHLGGADLDQKITVWLIEEFRKENGIDLAIDRTTLWRLNEAAEKAKCELSGTQQAEIVLPFIAGSQSAPKHLNAILSRAKFEQLIEPLLDRTLVPCKQALEDAEIASESIDDIILVGGQTRTPKVADTVGRLFGREPSRSPDEAAAIGAAMQVSILDGEVTDIVLLDVIPHTFGIETGDGTFVPLIKRNATIPTRKGHLFTTVTDNQTKVDVHVLQGENAMAASNTSLGGFRLTGIAPAPKGTPQIEVSFEIDVNGIIQVEAIDQASGSRERFIARAGRGLPPFTTSNEPSMGWLPIRMFRAVPSISMSPCPMPFRVCSRRFT